MSRIDYEAMYGHVEGDAGDGGRLPSIPPYEPPTAPVVDVTKPLAAKVTELEKVVQEQHRTITRMANQMRQAYAAINKLTKVVNDLDREMENKIDRRD